MGLVGCGNATPTIPSKSGAPPRVSGVADRAVLNAPVPVESLQADVAVTASKVWQPEWPRRLGVLTSNAPPLAAGASADPMLKISGLPLESPPADKWVVFIVSDDAKFFYGNPHPVLAEDSDLKLLAYVPKFPSAGKYAGVCLGYPRNRAGVFWTTTAQFNVGSAHSDSQPWKIDVTPKEDGQGNTTEFVTFGPIRAGSESRFSFSMQREGQPLSASIVLHSFNTLIVNEDLSAVAPAANLPGTMQFAHIFPSPGMYRLYLTYRTSKARTFGPPQHVVFCVNVSEANAPD